MVDLAAMSSVDAIACLRHRYEASNRLLLYKVFELQLFSNDQMNKHAVSDNHRPLATRHRFNRSLSYSKSVKGSNEEKNAFQENRNTVLTLNAESWLKGSDGT